MNIGQYQNNILDLPDLGDDRYENIFKVYNVKDTDKNYNFYNILKKVNIPDTIDETILDYYTPSTNVPWTILSYRIYKTQYLWWLIFLLNKPSTVFYAESGKSYKYILPEYIQQVLNTIKDQLT